jgi:arylsulfatase A-like enzyme
VKARMRAYDLFPTLLELCGLAVPPNLDAQSLMPWLDGREPAPQDRDASFEFMLWGDRELKGRIVGSKKFFMAGTGENHVYDLATDRFEQHDLAESQVDFVQAQRAALTERLPALDGAQAQARRDEAQRG